MPPRTVKVAVHEQQVTKIVFFLNLIEVFKLIKVRFPPILCFISQINYLS